MESEGTGSTIFSEVALRRSKSAKLHGLAIEQGIVTDEDLKLTQHSGNDEISVPEDVNSAEYAPDIVSKDEIQVFEENEPELEIESKFEPTLGGFDDEAESTPEFGSTEPIESNDGYEAEVESSFAEEHATLENTELEESAPCEEEIVSETEVQDGTLTELDSSENSEFESETEQSIASEPEPAAEHLDHGQVEETPVEPKSEEPLQDKQVDSVPPQESMTEMPLAEDPVENEVKPDEPENATDAVAEVSEEEAEPEDSLSSNASILGEEPQYDFEAEIQAEAEKLADQIGPVVDIQRLPKTKPSRVNSKTRAAAQAPIEKAPVRSEEKEPFKKPESKISEPKKKKRVSLLDSYFKGL